MEEKKTLKIFQKQKVIPKYVLPENSSFDKNDPRNSKKVDPFECSTDSNIFSKINLKKHTQTSAIDEFIVDETNRGAFVARDEVYIDTFNTPKRRADLFEKEDVDYDDTKVDDLDLAMELLTWKTEAPKWKPTTIFEEPEEKEVEFSEIATKLTQLKNESNKLIDKYNEEAIESFNDTRKQQQKRSENINTILSDIGDLEKQIAKTDVTSRQKNENDELQLNSLDDINAYILKQQSTPSRGLFD